jgi:hypothetical protein
MRDAASTGGSRFNVQSSSVRLGNCRDRDSWRGGENRRDPGREIAVQRLPEKGSIFKGEIRKSTVLVAVILKRRDLSTITNT